MDGRGWRFTEGSFTMKNVFVCTYLYVEYIDMFICMYVCMYVCIYVFAYLFMSKNVCIKVFTCVHFERR